MKVFATPLVTGAGIALVSDDQLITIMVRPGTVHTVSDKMRNSASVLWAINHGLITVITDSDISSDFVSQSEILDLAAKVGNKSDDTGFLISWMGL